MKRDLERIGIPGAVDAEERAARVVTAAFAERQPVPTRRRAPPARSRSRPRRSQSSPPSSARRAGPSSTTSAVPSASRARSPHSSRCPRRDDCSSTPTAACGSRGATGHAGCSGPTRRHRGRPLAASSSPPRATSSRPSIPRVTCAGRSPAPASGSPAGAAPLQTRESPI